MILWRHGRTAGAKLRERIKVETLDAALVLSVLRDRARRELQDANFTKVPGAENPGRPAVDNDPGARLVEKEERGDRGRRIVRRP